MTSKLIAITGTHGTGKTTLSYQLAAHYKEQGKNVKIIQEVARSCPFPLNDKMTKETALWIYHEHSKKELEAARDFEIVICDRTVFDSFVYASSMKINLPYRIIRSGQRGLRDSYEKIYFVRPDIPLIGDGVRSEDIEFQKEVDELFAYHLKEIPYIELKSSQIFDKEKSWKQFL